MRADAKPPPSRAWPHSGYKSHASKKGFRKHLAARQAVGALNRGLHFRGRMASGTVTASKEVSGRPKPRLARFTSKAHVLVELGERMVRRPSAAVSELVKNAYDADASWCRIEIDPASKTMVISDDGHGMDEAAFLSFWMVVASEAKRIRTASRYYKRPLAGAKGLGRLGVAFLGTRLTLVSHAFDREEKSWYKLSAEFDWKELVEGDNLSDRTVAYTYQKVEAPPAERTRLEINSMRHDWDEKLLKETGTEIAELCEPQLLPSPDAPEPFDFSRPEKSCSASNDPGFRVHLGSVLGGPASEGVQDEILSRTETRLEFRTQATGVRYSIWVEDEEEKTDFTVPFDLAKVGKVSGKIHVIPRENKRLAGLKTVDGREAQTWIHEHSGVRVFFQRFRVFPYGTEKDDWLQVSMDLGKSERKLRSKAARDLLEKEAKRIADELGEDTSAERVNLMLHMPRITSVVGAVSIMQESQADAGNDSEALIPAVNREGFIQNKGFEVLTDIVRTGMEFVAAARTSLVFRKKERVFKERLRTLKSLFRTAVQEVKADSTLPSRVKGDLVGRLEELEERSVAAQESAVDLVGEVESMGLLGGLAAFMTHEMRQLLGDLEALKTQFQKHENQLQKLGLTALAQAVETRHQQLEGQMEYVELFVRGRKAPTQKINVRAQVDLVIETMAAQVDRRGITVLNDVPSSLKTPPWPITALSGVLMNLYTNAVKWVLDEKNVKGDRRILFSGEPVEGGIVIRVSDTGPGVDPAFEDLIFMPGFTTVSSTNPFHTGMGLGLHIVKRIMGQLGGSIRLADPVAGYKTTFEVLLGDS